MTSWGSRVAIVAAAFATVACGSSPVRAPSTEKVVVHTNEADSTTMAGGAEAAWLPGGARRVELMLDPAQRREVACATPASFQGMRCAFTFPDLRAELLARGTLLQPFKTVDGDHVIAADMWLPPAVQDRLEASSAPFVVSCELAVLGQATDAHMRNHEDGPWSAMGSVPVVRASSCRITQGADAPPEVAVAPAPTVRVHIPLASHSPRLGPAHAKVTIVQFADHECPHCARLAPLLETIANANPKDVAVVFRHFPLPSHPRAMPSAVAVQAAQRQGKGTALSLLLFANFKALTDADILGYAQTAGLKMWQFRRDLADPKVRAEVDADAGAAKQSLAVRGTPTVFVNCLKYAGPRTQADFQQAIDEERKRADAALARGVARKDLYDTLCQ